MPAATVAHRKPSAHRGNRRLQHLFVLVLFGMVAYQLGTSSEELLAQVASSPFELLVFMALVTVIDSLDVEMNGLRLTLDFPLLLAVAVLYSPAMAMAAGLLASVDWREAWRGSDRAWNALFNRGQIALSVFLAGSVLQWISPTLESVATSALGTLVALLIDYLANTTLVAFHLSIRDGRPIGSTMSELWYRAPASVLGIYLGYGCLGLLLAYLGQRVGVWSIVAFLIPTVAAQRLLVATLRLRDLTRQLEVMRRHVDLLIDQIGEERRDERRRISGDIHDDILQSLLRIALLGKLLKQRLPDELGQDPDLRELVRESSSCAAQLRVVINDLRESAIGRKGLVESIQSLVFELRRVSRVEIELEIRAELEISPERQLVAYQVVREGLNNALRHAAASRIIVLVATSPEFALVQVSDDGQGFRSSDVDASRHFGLALCKERMARVGGHLAISNDNKGTSLKAIFPLMR